MSVAKLIEGVSLYNINLNNYILHDAQNSGRALI